jgi:HEAT repeat protein
MESLDTYLEQVTEKDIRIVVDALEHLENFKDVRAVTVIQNAFFHHKPEVRQAAAQSAGENLDESLLEALLSLLDDKNPQVRLAAVSSVGKFAVKGHEKKVVLALLERQPEPQTEKAVENIVLGAGAGVIPILESELNSLDKKRRERAINILPNMGDLGVMTLITNLPNLNVWESKKTAKKLGSLDHPMLVDYFLEMLQYPQLEKRSFAMTALGSGTITLKAVEAVGQVLLNDPDQYMRLDAAYYLKWVMEPIVLNYLDQYDPNKEKGLYGRWIREMVRDTRILLDLQEKPLIEIFALLFAGEKHERPLACVEISRREDPVAIPFLANALLSESSNNTKGNILVSLSDLEAVEAVDEILAFFHGSYTNTEDALALRTLGRLYHPKALDYLQERASKPILNDIPAEKEPIESARSAVKLAEHRMDFMRQAWFTVVEDGVEKRVFIALQLAMRGDDRGVDLLMDNFGETESRAIRYQTLRALGESGSVLVLPFLKDALKSSDERLVWHALIAIGQLPLEKAPAEVSAMLLDESPLVRMAALFALGNLKDSKTIPFILNHLEDGDQYVRAVAILTLQKFDFQEDWLPLLEPLVSDDCTWVRLEVARLFLGELLIPSREALMHMLQDENTQIRFFGTKLAGYHLEEDLRSALEYCASIKGFERITLQPGETRTVRFTIGSEQLQYLDEDMQMTVEPGEFILMVGGSSETVQEITLEVVGD